MSAGIKANVDGSAAIQVGGTDVITLTSGGAATFVTSPTTVQSGTAAAPSITTSGDTNTGIFFPAADTIAFAEGGVESVRFDSSGRLLVGTTTAITSWGSGAAQQIQATASGAANPGFSSYAFSTSPSAAGMINLGHSRNATVGTITTTQSGDALGYLVFEGATSNNALTGGAYISAIQSGAAGASYIPAEMRFYTSDTTNGNVQRATITSDGNLLVAATSQIGTARVQVLGNDAFSSRGTTSANAGTWKMYRADTGAKAWSIEVDGSNFYIADDNFSNYAFLAQNPTAWQFASDVRIKKNIQDLTYGLDTVMAIKPRSFEYIATNKHDIGFIAQELRDVIPEAVSGVEQEFLDTDTENERAAKTLGVGKETLIPVLVKAIQEQQAMIDELKAKVAALEGA